MGIRYQCHLRMKSAGAFALLVASKFVFNHPLRRTSLSIIFLLFYLLSKSKVLYFIHGNQNKPNSFNKRFGLLRPENMAN
jgi:hypothetical protein